MRLSTLVAILHRACRWVGAVGQHATACKPALLLAPSGVHCARRPRQSRWPAAPREPLAAAITGCSAPAATTARTIVVCSRMLDDCVIGLIAIRRPRMVVHIR